MPPELHRRHPGAALPEAAREAALRAARRRRPADPRLLERVRDSLIRLQGTSQPRHYIEIPGDTLATPAPFPPAAQRPP